MPDTTKTTIATWSGVIARTLSEHYELNPEPLFAAVDIDFERRHDPQYRIPVATMTLLWNAAVEATQDSAFGLEVARHVNPTTFHALGYAAMASNNGAEAIERLRRYSHLISDVANLRLHSTPDGLKLSLELVADGPVVSCTAMEAFMAAIVHMCRHYLNIEPHLKAVELQRTASDCTERYSAFFKAPVYFGAMHHGVILSPTNIATPLPTANPVLAAANDQLLEAWLQQSQYTPLQQRIMSIMHQTLPETPRQEIIAREMHMSIRSLQRHLEAEQTNFQLLLDTTRYELAKQYLRNPGLSVQQISDQLGFANPSAFTRAFKRWCDVTPEQYRIDPKG
jgi:AraC-like DNA-binding protein